MKKFYLFTLSTMLAVSTLFGQGSLSYTIELRDSFGDGWNGATIDVLVNGVVVLDNITLSGGLGPAIFNFSVDPGNTITTNFVTGYAWWYECEYQIKNELGEVVAQSGQGGVTPGNITYVVPSVFRLENGNIISLNRISVGFSEGHMYNDCESSITITEYGYIYEEGLSPAWGSSPRETAGTNVTIAGESDHPIAATAITGLIPGTEYYASSYATDGINVWFGDEMMFTTCSEDTILNNDPGVCGAVVSYNIPSASGADIRQIDTTNLTTGDLFPVGVTYQAWELDFGDEEKDTCSFTITVIDSEAPVFDCPADITVNTAPGECHAVVNYEMPDVIAFSDTFIRYQTYGNCSKWETFCSQLLSDYQYTRLTMKGTYDPVGVTLTDPVKILQIANALREGVFLQVNDNGQYWSVYSEGSYGIELTGDGIYWDCNSKYAVRPCIGNYNWGGIGTYSCSDYGALSQRMTVEFEIANTGNLSVTDNCDSSLTVVQTAGLPSGSEFPVGTTTNTFTVTDSSGNTTECSFNITVEDNEAPTVVCNPLDVILRENGEYVLNRWDIEKIVAEAADNCTPYEELKITVTPKAFECIHTHEPVTVTVSVEDASGNIASCQTTVTVIDNTPPVMLCQDIEVELDASGNALIFPEMLNLGSTSVRPSWARTYNNMGTGSYDACGIEFMELSQNEFSCQHIGPNTVTLTAGDPNGNVSECQVTVTVVEHELPWVTCKDAEITLDENGVASLTADMVVAEYGDLCGVDTIIVEPMSFDCSTTGENQVTVTVIDRAGNESSCTATVMVHDNQSPEITQVDDIEIVVEPGVCVTPIADYPEIVATDDCGAELTLDEGYGPNGLFPLGTSVETWKAEDQAGNVTTMSFSVTVTTYNGAPAIDPVEDITMVKDSGNMVMALTGITPGIDCEEQMVTGVTIASSDTSVVKAVITYIEGNDSAQVTFIPVDFGEAEITVTVQDDGGTENGGTDVTEITFTVKVVEELPVFAGFDPAGKLDVTLYPNPTKDMVNLKISKNVSGTVDVAVYTITGKQVIRRVFSDIQLISFSMEDNVSGMYFVKMNVEGKEFVKKLILDR